MDSNTLPTAMLVAAQVRIAAQSGVPIVVTRRGDDNVGALFVKINTLNGMARVFARVWSDDESVWTCVSGANPWPESDADTWLEQQSSFDTDAWIVEVEDRQGRLWFPGKMKET